MFQMAIAESAEVRRCLIGSLTVLLGDGLPGQPISGLDGEWRSAEVCRCFWAAWLYSSVIELCGCMNALDEGWPGDSSLSNPVFIELREGRSLGEVVSGRRASAADVRAQPATCVDVSRAETGPNQFAFSFHRKCHTLEDDLWTNQMIS